MSLDVSLSKVMKTEVYSANITHNLAEMAIAVGIYEALWQPQIIKVKYANELIPTLTEGLKNLKSNPIYYKTFNAENGWGTDDDFIRFVEEYLNACKENPDAKVEADV